MAINDMVEWYHIPGFNGYQINAHTSQVRSFKNHKADPFHLMTVDKNGKISITADTMKRVTIFPRELYDKTFNSGENLIPAMSGEIYLGARGKLNRSQPVNLNMMGPTGYSNGVKDVTIDFSKYVTH
ncbi:MAG: hypothetical protein WCR33_06210 [Bacilli bacterium]